METSKIVIIGSGPAGYSAAIYTSRAQLKTILFGGWKSGGQLMNTTEVENYAGFSKGIQGPDLMFGMREQAQKFGTIVKDEYVTAVDFSQKPFKIWTNLPNDQDPADFANSATSDQMTQAIEKIKQNEPAIMADSVIIATGASPIMLNVPGEKEFFAKGVSACAVCDAAFFKEKITYVVGGGDSAMEEATALAKFASEVHIVHRRDQFKASKIMIERVLNNPKIKVHWNSTLKEILGNKVVEKVKINENGNEVEYPAQGVFLAIGHKPMNDIFKNQILIDNHGYVITRQSATKQGVEMAQSALSPEGLVQFPTMTSVEGVFAAGDGVDVRYKQAISAAGQGCMASLDAERWLEQQS
ncbi:MAG: FAD-dependent oxidoreductase [Pseudomonadales bacterium]|nr:FAD-dependent oxidoreductase [Pseudomonadales bacterium]